MKRASAQQCHRSFSASLNDKRSSNLLSPRKRGAGGANPSLIIRRCLNSAIASWHDCLYIIRAGAEA